MLQPFSVSLFTASPSTAIGDIDVDIWSALYVPAGTPKAIVEKLSSTANTLLKSPEVKESLIKQGLMPTGSSPAQLAELTKTDVERWGRVVQQAKIEAD